MNTIEIYPAIDLLEGEVVRLRQGNRDQKTVYGRKPGKIAEKWMGAGVRWLHVVNLDGAFGTDARLTRSALREVFSAAGREVRVQVGGGVRSFGDVEALLIAGASRVILGTAAIENQQLLEQLVGAFGPEYIVVGIDARDGQVRTHGWQSEGGLDAVELGNQVAGLGIRTVIYTDISRDGMGAGVDRSGAQALKDLGLEVIVSGGAASLEDVVRVRQEGLDGIIIGRALYEGDIDLAKAVAAAKGEAG